MANICENELRVYSENAENLNYIDSFCRDHFEVSLVCSDDLELHITFNSKWNFPEELMEKMFKNIPDKEDINMVCLSTEWGNYYAAFHVCNSKGWRLE